MNTRIKKLIQSFKQYKIDALLIQKDINIRYLTGFLAHESWLLVTAKKVYYITDFRYVLEAKKGLEGVVIKQYTDSFSKTLFEAVKAQRVKRLGFDETQFSVLRFKQLKKAAPRSVRLVAANGIVEDIRAVKDAQELQLIRQALKVHSKAYKYMKSVIRPGLTEREVLIKLEKFVKSTGATFSFSPIVATGPNSCLPHAKITDRKIQRNDVVLLDMGIDIKGYKSDLTRMFFLGKIPKLVRQVNDAVAEAQRQAIKVIKPGISVAEVDQQARNYLEKHNLSRFFGHSLGHGVGLEIHENPRLSVRSNEVLKEGMVVTVEPGVYIPDQFGIRIEDMALVTKNGCEVLSDDIN